ncbi:CubicO group peptidase (beta-lactamase class C family) [Rhizobium sp. BK650]|uniref:serine hydrolase domain-containing protein n=1 Tax=Rhizobium sp. BK650 TaxID=2586990 RepID=UPI00161FBAAB|nr:serine hydrolase domain-containing protein [Rhizobium sp. BK650]MBB3656637.1 CubicO group peptidase (beta-lactamase class C family) [Rhizobium sp. BK650]
MTEAERIDQLFEAWNNLDSPGCAVAVLRDGSVVYKRGFGMANLAHGIAIGPSTVFHSASVSKQFTAFAILLLAAEGKLSLDDDAQKYVPDLPDFGAPITLRHLLHHTSGLRDHWELLSLAGWRYSKDLITDDDILAVVSRQQDLNFQPGDEHLYCNTGYALLAQVVKTVSGQSLRAFTSARIFEPLGMRNTFFRDNYAEVVRNVADGYVETQSGIEISNTNFDTVGATSLLTTVEDLALWDENFYHPRVGGPDVIAQMLERGRLNDGSEIGYASGLGIGTYRGLTIVEHTGGDAGFRSDIIRFPEQHFSVAILANFGSIVPSDLVRRIADIYLADVLQPAPKPGPSTFPQPAADALELLTGYYAEPRLAGRVARLATRDGKLLGGYDIDYDGYALEAVDHRRFRFSDFPNSEIELEQQEGEPASELTSYFDGKRRHQYRRLPAYTPSPTELAALAGSYRPVENDMPYQVRVGEAGLVFKSVKSPEIKLTAVAPDHFLGDCDRFTFTRDENGRVTGLLMNSGRIRNVRFERL